MAKRPEERPSTADIVSLPHVRRGIAMLLVQGDAAKGKTEGDAALATPETLATLATLETSEKVEYTQNIQGQSADEIANLSMSDDFKDAGFLHSDDGAEQPMYMNNSLKQALESSIACEKL